MGPERRRLQPCPRSRASLLGDGRVLALTWLPGTPSRTGVDGRSVLQPQKHIQAGTMASWEAGLSFISLRSVPVSLSLSCPLCGPSRSGHMLSVGEDTFANLPPVVCVAFLKPCVFLSSWRRSLDAALPCSHMTARPLTSGSHFGHSSNVLSPGYRRKAVGRVLLPAAADVPRPLRPPALIMETGDK